MLDLVSVRGVFQLIGSLLICLDNRVTRRTRVRFLHAASQLTHRSLGIEGLCPLHRRVASGQRHSRRLGLSHLRSQIEAQSQGGLLDHAHGALSC